MVGGCWLLVGGSGFGVPGSGFGVSQFDPQLSARDWSGHRGIGHTDTACFVGVGVWGLGHFKLFPPCHGNMFQTCLGPNRQEIIFNPGEFVCVQEIESEMWR